MKKYLAFFRLSLMTDLQFRAETVLWLLMDLIPYVTMIFIWQAIYRGAATIQDYSLVQVMQYYVMVAMIDRLTAVHFESWRAEQIRDGKIDFHLIRPFSYLLEIYISNLASKFFAFCLFLPVLGMLVFIINFFIPGFSLPDFFANAPQFLVVLFAAHLIQFIFGLWIVLLTFWLEGSNGLEHFKWVTVALFSGSIMPVIFLPELMRQVVELLPFKYLFVVPIMLLQGQYRLVPFDYLYMTGVILGMLALTAFIWKKARLQYSSVGG